MQSEAYRTGTMRTNRVLRRGAILLLITMAGCPPPTPPGAPVTRAYDYLYGVMDEWHMTYDVYTDLSDPGSHFLARGRMASDGSGDWFTLAPGCQTNPHRGATCIECRFESHGMNWAGWYFLTGTLAGEEMEPSPNWGEVPNAGVDLTGAKSLEFWVRGSVGGERVEFFAFGAGRNSGTGAAFAPYPDSSPKVSLGYITLTTEWTHYSIDLGGVDLTYVLGGFGFVTNAPSNDYHDITFYLDDIQYDLSQMSEPRFLRSYSVLPGVADMDAVMVNAAFTYDNALALIALLARGTLEDCLRAQLIARAFVHATHHDRFFTDGRLRNAYQAGDLVLPPGWTPNGRPETTRMPGWWSDTGVWQEDRFQVSTHTGNVAWAAIALLSYHDKLGGAENLDAAQDLMQWVVDATYDTRGAGGFTGGYEGWEPTSNRPEGQTRVDWKSTEHNIDVYVACARLYEATGDSAWRDHALHAKAFVESMWDDTAGRFYTGTTTDGVTIDTTKAPADVNTWALLALPGGVTDYAPALDWVEANCGVTHNGFTGYDFDNDLDGVWFEGTAHMAVAYQAAGDATSAETLLGTLELAQDSAPNADGNGLAAATRDGLTTGFDWAYFSRLHVGATAWFVLAELGWNPYWGISAEAPVPALE